MPNDTGRMDHYVGLINTALESYLPDNDDSIVCRAMRYSMEGGGKRIRPVLTLEFCRLCGGSVESALPFACAVEMVHTYSLIHDDLPCMDNDDMRRGKPSCHKKFGEEFALLAGDGLLTLAFETLFKAEGLPAQRILEAGRQLSAAAGWAGMIGGQELDMINENKAVPVNLLIQTDTLKTGKLITAAAALGCIAAGADSEAIQAAQVYATNIGLAFQIVDDILDVTGDIKTLGKPVGSDKENDKSTYVTVLGLEESRKAVNELTRKAKSALLSFGSGADFLLELAEKLEKREK